MKRHLLSIFALAVLMAVSAVGFAQTTFTKITSANELVVGENYLIVAHNNDLGVLAMGYQNTNNRKAVVVTESGNAISVIPGTDPNNQNDVFQFTLGGSANAWTFFDEVKGGYLYAASSSANNLKTQSVLDANGQWSITFNADGTAEVIAQGSNERNNMRFNPNTQNNAPLFSCYASSSNVNTRVSFYKAGSAVIAPEPTNYPTNFAARVSGLDITLTWTDAVGGQLPHKYVVVGAEEDIPFGIPVDGNPLPNGFLVANVNYGVQTVTFEGLEGGVLYRFAIFPYTNSGDNIDYKTDGNYPTAQATTESMSSLFYEDFTNDLGEFTTYNIVGEQEWQQASYQSTTYADMNGYASGAAHANEDWLISPEIHVPTDVNYDAIYMEFRNAVKFDGNPLQVLISTDYQGGAPYDANWTDLSDGFDFSTGEFNWVESGQVNILNEIAGRTFFYVAFLYTSTDQAAAHWEIDWVDIVGVEAVAVNENTVAPVSVYPNPAHDVVSFNLNGDAQVSIYDVTGRMVSTMNMVAGQCQCPIANLENGVYFLNIRYADGKNEVARFVKF